MAKIEICFNPHVLITYVNDYFYAEEERRLFLRKWKGGWWESKTAQEREDYTKYSERSDKMWDALVSMCQMINIDIDRLLAIVKSINRYDKNHGKYDRNAHINEHKFLKVILISDGWGTKYYFSTGRIIKCVEE